MRVVIVGGGISGLSAAYYLSKAGIRPTIVEVRDRLGGVILTEYIEGCTVEAGPDSFLTSKTAARELIEEIGLGDQLIGSNDHVRATFIWRGGRLIKLPDGMTMMVPGRIGPIVKTPLLSWPGKLRAGIDLLKRPTRIMRDRSLSEFINEHYGREVFDYIAEPMLAGIYGGDPARMSVLSVVPTFAEWEAKYGSLTRGALKEVKRGNAPLFTTLKSGLQVLVDELVRIVRPDVIRGRVERIEKGWRVRVNGDWLECDHLVVACRAASVLPNLFPEIPYNPATVIAVGYRRSDIPHELKGFGFLVPRIERTALSACTIVNNKFSFRTPEDKILLRCFTAGATADVQSELRQKLGIKAEPLFTRVYEWPNSMPQPNVGHSQNVKLIEDMLKDFPGLHLAGNAYYGIGIPDCIRMGRQVAETVARAKSIS
jgi:oxygen-dependent protoporphyrinogen oxidase